MNWFRSLSVFQKILMVPLIGTLGFVIYLTLNIQTAGNNAGLLESVRDRQFPLLQIAERSLVRLDRIKDTLATAVSTGEEEALQQADSQAETIREDMNRAATLTLDRSKEIKEIVSAFDAYFSTARGISSGMISGDIDFSTLGARSEKMTAQLETVESLLEAFRTEQFEEFSTTLNAANEANQSSVKLGLVIGVVMIVILFAFSTFIATTIRRNLSDVVSSLKDIAQENGDLTVRIKTLSKDEIGELVHWFNSFMDKLQAVITQVVHAALPLSKLARDLNELMTELNQTLEFQIGSSDRAKQAVEEMNHNVESVVSSANGAAEAARDADQEAKSGQGEVDKTVSSIEKLSSDVMDASEVIRKLEEDANRVSVVVDVIRGIADQTNLLALNAAIEAARAGEQGRGFAVVADEVRSLASKTQESTEEINKTIEQLQTVSRNAVEVMKKGNEQAERSVGTAKIAGESLVTITRTISRISDMNDQIAEAIETQRDISQSIVSNVSDIHERTAQTSERSVNLGQVASDLGELAHELEDVARQFRI